jgi:uncharacterized protein YwgA
MTDTTKLTINNIKFAEPIGKVGDINKLKNVIKFILKNLSENTTKYKTEIIKLCFIVDYQYSKQFKKNNPTSVTYVRYNYGPYSESFIEAFNELVNECALVEVSLPFGLGYSSISPDEPVLSEEVKEFIKKTLGQYKNSSLKQMKEYIYALPEFKATEFGHEIELM